MKMLLDTKVDASKEKVWQIISNIEGSADVISGIEGIEILDKPTNGLVGLKWEETRIMFGKTATEVMWITESEKNQHYKTRAEGPGVIYETTLAVADDGPKTSLSMQFESEATSLGSRILSGLMSFFIKKSMSDAIEQDLVDIKAAAEKL